MTKNIHALAGSVAILTIATFWLSTVVSELWGSAEAIASVKGAIPWGFLLLVPMLVATGGSGFAAARGRRAGRIGVKLKRMPFIAANGLFVLIPSALFLALKAEAHELDATFYSVQAIELIAGAINLVLLGMNMRDGLKLSGRYRRTLRT